MRRMNENIVKSLAAPLPKTEHDRTDIFFFVTALAVGKSVICLWRLQPSGNVLFVTDISATKFVTDLP
jgi:hypothetical protein